MQDLGHGFKQALKAFEDFKAKSSIVDGEPGHAALMKETVIELGKLLDNAYPVGGMDTDEGSSLISMLTDTSLEMASRSEVITKIWAKVREAPTQCVKQLLGHTGKT